MTEPTWDLHYAALQGDASAVQALLDQGYDPNAFDDMAFTPLHHAANHEHLDVIRLLLRAGADVNARDVEHIGDSPLGQVAGTCSLAVAQALVTAGADPTVRGWMGLCALDRAEPRTDDEGRRVHELLRPAALKFRNA